MNLSSNRISIILDEWQQVKKELTILFEKRDKKNTEAPMLKGIDLFQQLLFLCNNKEPINQFIKEEMIICFKWKPVNVFERLTFIQNKPNLYHSFVQLNELITEQIKQYNKKIAIEKMTKQ
ncbi:YpoC family protein [Neobacillus sp. D3-1R]|uniref:YpoC family protein n=1 Tax=Neobacillus sp. D3-1R TaxID=3445778 RepID=UPI003FA13EB7